MLSVGQLARRAGLTVRTLHHYDAIGLLAPTKRSRAGYRLYDAADVERLTQIVLLRRLDLSLDQIGELLSRPDTTLQQTLERQISHLRDRIETESRLLQSLEAIQQRLARTQRVSVDQLTTLLERMAMFEKYYTPEQLEYLKKRRDELGEERIHRAEAEWPELIAQMREEMAKGSDPASATVQTLARRWQELVEAFTGGDAGVTASLGQMYTREPDLQQRSGLDPELMQFVATATAAAASED